MSPTLHRWKNLTLLRLQFRRFLVLIIITCEYLWFLQILHILVLHLRSVNGRVHFLQTLIEEWHRSKRPISPNNDYFQQYLIFLKIKKTKSDIFNLRVINNMNRHVNKLYFSYVGMYRYWHNKFHTLSLFPFLLSIYLTQLTTCI